MPSTKPWNAVRAGSTPAAAGCRATARAWLVDTGTGFPSSFAFHICLTFIRGMSD
jgi:hypothetical protein